MLAQKGISVAVAVAVVTLFLLAAVPSVHVSLAAARSIAAETTEEPRPAEEIAAIRKGRVELAQKGYEAAVVSLQRKKRIGEQLVLDGKPEDVYQWSLRWLQARREMSAKKGDQVDALEAHVKRMKELDEQVRMLSRDLLPRRFELDAEWYRLEAQLWLVEERAK
jgi:hypothetical protein